MTTYRYHWTHRSNLESIARTGLDPACARGRMRVVWSCGTERVLWAVGHVASHHQCSPDDMVLLRIAVRPGRWRRTSWPDVLVSETRVPPSAISVRLDPLAGRWLSVRRVGG